MNQRTKKVLTGRKRDTTDGSPLGTQGARIEKVNANRVYTDKKSSVLGGMANKKTSSRAKRKPVAAVPHPETFLCYL